MRDVTSKSTGEELRFATSGPETIRPMRRAAVPLASGPKTDRNSAPSFLIPTSLYAILPMFFNFSFMFIFKTNKSYKEPRVKVI